MRLQNETFDVEYLNKIASQMVVGNGYLGIRGVHEEDYENQDRGFFINGIFNKSLDSTISELVNLPDITKIILKVDGEIFSLSSQRILHFEKYLDFTSGEMVREIQFITKLGKCVTYQTRRLVSQTENVIAQKMVLFADKAMKFEIISGIDAQVTNCGVQHLIEKDILVSGGRQMTAEYQTFQTRQRIVYDVFFNHDAIFQSKNRQITGKFVGSLVADQVFELEKITYLQTSLQSFTSDIIAKDYSSYYKESLNEWSNFWAKHRITIEGDDKSQFAIDFALYHLHIMVPRSDSRLSIGAKGLTGQGYKGHVFWDTEIFLLPFVLHNQPEIAKNLLMYRHRHLEEAKNKAKERGYEGALFPWESAFTGEEETPEYAAINIRTGLRQKVASGDAEQHIVADIAYAVEDYFTSTADSHFMYQVGFELLRESAKFWLSRVTEMGQRLEIHNVIGPDEYTEYIDNNAYTNYMAYYNVSLAIKYGLGDADFQRKCQQFLKKLYLPQPNSDLLIPQDDTFLSKVSIDLSKYKEMQGAQTILLDYSRSEINEMQVLKQADVVMLLYLFPKLFVNEIVAKNVDYYEERTIHDSSLSKAVYAIQALRCNKRLLGYRLFQEATLIDLGDAPHSSDEGLHAAALASLWHVVVFGFAGIEKDEILCMNPKIPRNWTKLTFPFVWNGIDLLITITDSTVTIVSQSDKEIQVKIGHKAVSFTHEIKVTI